MKKTLLALAITALSANAFAADVDYTAATPVVNTIASELNIPALGLVTTADDLTWDLGFSVTTATQRYVKIALTGGAKFTNAPSLTADGAPAVFSQGGAGFDFVIFEVTPAADLTTTDDVVVTLNNLTIASKTSIGVSYQLFETAVDAVNGTNALVNKAAAPYINFASGIATRVQAPTDAQRVIDVSATPSSTEFIFGNTATIGAVAVAAVPGLVTYNTATTATLANLVAAGTSLVVTGDFSAGLKNGAGVLQPTAVLLNGVAATAVTANSATFNIGVVPVGTIPAAPAAPTFFELDYVTNGTDAIAPSTYSVAYDVTPAAGTSTADVNLGKIGELAKNGATEYVDLALKPGGVYSNYLRISNKTSVAGNVYITLINDAGASTNFALGDIQGQTTSVLGAQASTTQITIQQVFDAAAANGFVLANEGKLRLVVDAEIPSGPDGGLSVQTYTVSKDANNLNRF